MGAKRGVSSLHFVWNFNNIDYLKFSLTYGRYTKQSVFQPISVLIKSLDNSLHSLQIISMTNNCLCRHLTQGFNCTQHTRLWHKYCSYMYFKSDIIHVHTDWHINYLNYSCPGLLKGKNIGAGWYRYSLFTIYVEQFWLFILPQYVIVNSYVDA
jgi:hypothetical protein